MIQTGQGTNSVLTYSSVSLLNGELSFGELSGVNQLSELAAKGITHIATLQTEIELLPQIEDAVHNACLQWIWLPFQINQPLRATQQAYLQQYLILLKKRLNETAHIHLHCDQQCKRSSLIILALCHFLGLSAGDSYRLLHTLDSKKLHHLTTSEKKWAEQLGSSITAIRYR